MEPLKIGDRVTATRLIYEGPNEDTPGGVYAQPGTVLIVRGFDYGERYPVRVSHEDVERAYFGVEHDEIEIIETRKNLAYHVKVDGWPKVNQIMKEFKKKRHANFSLEVTDLGLEVYRVKVFQND